MAKYEVMYKKYDNDQQIHRSLLLAKSLRNLLVYLTEHHSKGYKDNTLSDVELLTQLQTFNGDGTDRLLFVKNLSSGALIFWDDMYDYTPISIDEQVQEIIKAASYDIGVVF